MRRVVPVVSWCLGTFVAMACASAAVLLTSATVSERSAASVSRNEVVQGLSAAPPTSVAAPSTTAEAPAVPPSGVDSPSGSAPATATTEAIRSPDLQPAPPGAGPGATPTTTRATGDDPPGDDHGGGAGHGGGPGPSPTTTTGPTSTVPAPVDRTVVLEGGTVRLRCVGTAISIVSIQPSSGFRSEVKAPGPQEARVELRSSTHRSEVRAWCAGPIIDIETVESTSGGDATPH